MTTKMIYKIGFGILILFAAIFGSSYLFNHVNAWLGVLVPIVGGIIFLGLIVPPVYNYIKNKNQNKL